MRGLPPRRCRKDLGLTLKELGDETGLDWRRLSELEVNRFAPSAELRATLTDRLAIPRDPSLDRCPPYQTRPFDAHRDHYRFRQRRQFPTFQKIKAAFKLYPDVMTKLEQKVPPWTLSFLRRVICDSGLEALALFHWLAQPGAVPGHRKLTRVGFRHHEVVDPKEGLVLSDHAFPMLLAGDMLLIFQVPLRANGAVYVLDVLVKYQGRWIDLELDGKGHTTERDLLRDKDLAIPVVRVTEAFVHSLDFLDNLKPLLKAAKKAITVR